MTTRNHTNVDTLYTNTGNTDDNNNLLNTLIKKNNTRAIYIVVITDNYYNIDNTIDNNNYTIIDIINGIPDTNKSSTAATTLTTSTPFPT